MPRFIKTALAGLLLLSPAVVRGQAEIIGVEPADAPAAAEAQAAVAPLPKTPVLLLPFGQTAGDDTRAWVGPALFDRLGEEMREAGFSLVALPAGGPVQIAPAVDVKEAQRLGVAARADLVVFGGYRSIEHELRINGQVIEVGTGRTVAELRAAGALRDRFMLEEMLLEQIDAAVREHAAPATQPGDLVDAQPVDPARPYDDQVPYTPETAPAEPPYVDSSGAWYPDYDYTPATVYAPPVVVYPEVYTSYSFFYGYYPYRYYYPYYRGHHHHHDRHYSRWDHRDDRRDWFEDEVQGRRGDRGPRFRDDFRRDDRGGDSRSFRDGSTVARSTRSGHLGEALERSRGTGGVTRVNTPVRPKDSAPAYTGSVRRGTLDNDASTVRFRDRETYAPRASAPRASRERDRSDSTAAVRANRDRSSSTVTARPERKERPAAAPSRDVSRPSSVARPEGRFRDSGSSSSVRESAPSRRASTPATAAPRRVPAPSRSSGADRPARSPSVDRSSSSDRGSSFRSAPASDRGSSARSSSGGEGGSSRSSSGSSRSSGGRSSDSGGGRGGRGR
jgi:TolB-like protein